MTWTTSRALVAVGTALVVGGFIGSWWSGPTMAVGEAYSAETQVSIQTDNWTYAMPLDVAWVDEGNSWNSGSRPECVPPHLENIPDVRFAWVDVTVEGSTWREVIWVDCR